MTELSSSRSPATAYRPDIQGLRAVAVLAVLIYHIWPTALPGGYVGVDVFFVISGYLISALLLKEYQGKGRIDLPRFYQRRIRRLLPAATTVLLAVAICLPWLPSVRWQETVQQIAASGLWVQNWWLAFQAVDYLATDNAPGPLQHFWSLSVEEQYYLFWPLLFVLAGALPGTAALSGRLRFAWLIGGIFVLSLAWSIYHTRIDPGFAYFATTTRAWELALGGVLALTSHRWSQVGGIVRMTLGWLGLTCIAAACVFFDAGTEFPGYAALLPTVGAALAIMAGTNTRPGDATWLLSRRPMQYLGDLSYSLYLWHWPLIVFHGLFTGHEPGWLDGLAIAAVSIVLAHLSKVWVEDVFRSAPMVGRLRGARTFAFGAACIAGSIAIAFAVQHLARSGQQALGQETAQDAPLRPSLMDARNDIPDVYARGCHVGQRAVEAQACTWGSDDAAVRIVLVGDSIAAQWTPAMAQMAERRGDWQITSFTKSGCPFADVTVSYNQGRPYQACVEWNRDVMERILAMAPTLVVTTQARSQFVHGSANLAASTPIMSAGLRAHWQRLMDAGIAVAVIGSTPAMGIDVPDCLSAPTGSVETCGRTRAHGFANPEPVRIAAEELRGVPVIDMSEEICGDEFCPPIIGNVLVWRDGAHLTATFVRELAPALERELEHALKAIP